MKNILKRIKSKLIKKNKNNNSNKTNIDIISKIKKILNK